MERKDYTKRTDALLLKVLRIEREFEKIIVDYYDKHSSEKNKSNTEFYKEMDGILSSFGRCLDSMKYYLDNPDSIQRTPYSK